MACNEVFVFRKSWDTFLSEEKGSKIPVGWVLPTANARDVWKAYLPVN